MAAPEGLFVLEGRPTAQLIADQLREQIVQGTFRPGQQINESAVAGQLRTSRGPLREALQRLCQEGLLVSHRNRGVFVLELSTADIKEIYAVRHTVESAVVDALLDGGQQRLRETCKALKAVLRAMAKQVAASDWQAIARLDMQFHADLVAGAGNTRLVRIYQTLAAESRMCMLDSKSPTPARTSWSRNTRTSWTCSKRETEEGSSRRSNTIWKKLSRISGRGSRRSPPPNFSCYSLAG